MDRTDMPWPYWMLRYVGADDPEALDDLIWSVGGSPPYGGVSYEEAETIYNLVEQIMGPGMASKAAYKSAKKAAGKRADARDSIEILQCYDEVVSSPETFSSSLVLRGLELAVKINHSGARATFLALTAQIAYRNGDLQEASRKSMEALKLYLELAGQDPVYEMRVSQNATNTVSYTAMSGDLDEARRLLSHLSDFMEEHHVEQLSRSLS